MDHEFLITMRLSFSLPFMVSPIKSALISLPASLKEASYSLGKWEYYTLFLSYSLTSNPVC
ncbi:hypothetical protein HpHA181_00050 [Helicobacter pylori]